MDASGNSSTCSFNVTVTDNVLPLINCPADIFVHTDANECGAVVNFTVSSIDNCSSTVVSNPASGSLFLIGITTVNSFATDAAGNNSTCTFTVTVTDDESPIIISPGTMIVNAEDTLDSAVVNFNVMVTDNCSATVVTDPPSGSVFPIGITTVECIATDAAGNKTHRSFNVKVKDVTPPKVHCPADMIINMIPGDCYVPINFVVSASDNQNANVNVHSNPSPGSSFPVGTTIVHSVASDSSGNSTSCSFSVTVIDTELPVLSVPNNISVNADAGNCGAFVNFNVTATDNCSATVNSIPASGSFFSIGTTTVTSIATDLSGNISNESFDITVTDNQSPVIMCPADINRTTDPGVNGARVDFNVNTTDNCTAIVNSTSASGSIFPVGTTTVTSISMDASGNSVSCSFNVTVTDDEFPVINCPADIHVNNDQGMCGAVVNFNVTATDNSSAIILNSHASGSFFPIGTTRVITTATDLSGNISTCSFDVSVIDKEFPLIHEPSNIIVPAIAGNCSAVVNFTVTASDNCSAIVQANPVSGSVFLIGTTIVKTIATDASGNISIDSFPVTVIDDQLPIINSPSNIIVNATVGLCGAFVNYSVTASDNCSATVSVNPASGSFFPVGHTTVRCTSVDASGNMSSSSFVVTVKDREVPVISNCPSNITTTTGNNSWAVVTWVSPVATDNCNVTLSTNHNPGSTFPVGTTTVIYTATDPSGNNSKCSFNVYVIDNQAPVFSNCPSDIIINTSGSCDQLVSWTAPSITDNISSLLTSNYNPGQLFPLGSTVVTYTATDPSGNNAKYSFTITVEDHENPVITNCPGDIIAFENPVTNSANVMWFAPTVTDNCNYTIVCNNIPGTSFLQGTTLITYTATDVSGNASTCSFNITVTAATSVNEINNADRFVAYPNPITSELNLKINAKSMAKHYKIISMLGVEVLSGDMNGFEARINVEVLKVGTYVLEIKLNDGTINYQNIFKK